MEWFNGVKEWFAESLVSPKDLFIDIGERIAETKIPILIVVGALFVLAIIGIVVFRKEGKVQDKKGWTARQLAIGALCIALAFALSFIRFMKMPQGGSVTLASMLPIMIFAYVFGFRKGLLVGLAYGILQLFQDAYIVHWAQLFLDYILAFMVLAFAGIARKKVSPWTFLLGMIVAGVARFLAHVLSGAIFFAEYAPEGQNAFVYSMGYNSFVFVDLAICIILGMIFALTRIIKPLKLAR